MKKDYEIKVTMEQLDSEYAINLVVTKDEGCELFYDCGTEYKRIGEARYRDYVNFETSYDGKMVDEKEAETIIDEFEKF